jgi:hypothetical protein
MQNFGNASCIIDATIPRVPYVVVQIMIKVENAQSSII